MGNTDKYIGFEYNGIKVNMGNNADIKGFILNGRGGLEISKSS